MSKRTKRVMAAVLAGISLIGGAILAAPPVQAAAPAWCQDQACYTLQCGAYSGSQCSGGPDGCWNLPCKLYT
jgi:hypothetical protein